MGRLGRSSGLSRTTRTRYVRYEGDYEAYVVEPRSFVALTKAQAFSKSQRLDDLSTAFGAVPGRVRCGAHGLLRGGCYLERQGDSPYCYYHSKLAGGLLEHDIPVYPVWPLPAWGYRFVGESSD